MKRNQTTSRDAGLSGGWRAVGATFSPARRIGRGFTLTEILIVIGLIVLLIALAVPAFNAMTGGRSVDAAANQLSAMLGRARMEAIGLQEPRGLLFYRDPATLRVAARLVKMTGFDAATSTPGFDLVADRDPMLLPVGVSLQMVDDAQMSGTGTNAQARDDRYIGYNTRIGNTDVRVAVGGVILFDQGGRLSNKRYGFTVGRRPDKAKPGATQLVSTEMGRFLMGEKTPTKAVIVIARGASGQDSLKTQFGFVVYDDETFKNQGFTDDDPQMKGAGGVVGAGSAEGKEEAWLDANALPLLVNRYNGTLIRGE